MKTSDVETQNIMLAVQAYGVTTRAGGPPELVLEYCDQPNWGPHYFKAQ